MLPDGVYDVVVVEVEDRGDDRTVLDLLVLGGAHKGEVVNVAAVGVRYDPVEALGLPGTLEVTDGRPRVTLEP